MSVFFSGFMGNDSEHGINKSRKLRSSFRMICLFRTTIRYPWTQKKDTYSLYLQCFQQGPFLKFSDKRYKFKIPTATGI